MFPSTNESRTKKMRISHMNFAKYKSKQNAGDETTNHNVLVYSVGKINGNLLIKKMIIQYTIFYFIYLTIVIQLSIMDRFENSLTSEI